MTVHAPAYLAKRSHSGGVFIILFLLMIIGYAAIQVMLGTHAMEKHSDTATLTRDCIQQNGVWKYQEPKSTTFHWLCKDPSTGTIFDMIVEKVNETLYREKTSFLRKDGKWDQVSPSDYYFRTNPVFETSSPKYAWLNHTIAVGVGRFLPGKVAYRVFAIK